VLSEMKDITIAEQAIKLAPRRFGAPGDRPGRR
jgi:hypothetical protein